MALCVSLLKPVAQKKWWLCPVQSATRVNKNICRMGSYLFVTVPPLQILPVFHCCCRSFEKYISSQILHTKGRHGVTLPPGRWRRTLRDIYNAQWVQLSAVTSNKESHVSSTKKYSWLGDYIDWSELYFWYQIRCDFIQCSAAVSHASEGCMHA